MKNLFFGGLLLVLFISCDNQQRYTQQSSEIETTKTLIKDYNEKNYEAVVAHFADTANVYFNSATSFKASLLPEYHKDGDNNFVSRGFLEKGQEYEMVKTDDGKTWVNFWGTWKAELAANNEPIELQIHLTLQFIDGKVVTEFGYWDNAPITLAVQNSGNNKDIIASAYSNFAKGDIPAFLAQLDAKVEWNEAENFIYASDEPYIGPDAFTKGVLERIGNDWEYWKITDLQLNEMKNGMVLATGRYNAKHKKTGKILNAQVAHLWTLASNKIIKFQQYTDTKQAFDAIQ